MEVVDGGKRAQAVVANAEVGIPGFLSHVESKEEALAVNPLRQALKDSRDQQHMSIFNGANLFTPLSTQ